METPESTRLPWKIAQDRLRIIIGALGILLPVILLVIHRTLLSSISHYYYTSASVFFIGILSAFGLVLISYKGYPIDKTKENISDDWLATLAGLCVLIAVIIPTKCSGACETLQFCGKPYLLGHDDGTGGMIHLISAGLCLVILGWMCAYKFTLDDGLSKSVRHLYRYCGALVWASVAVLVVLYSIEKIWHVDFNDYFCGYTYVCETMAFWAFSIAWLVKGRVKSDIDNLSAKLTRRR